MLAQNTAPTVRAQPVISYQEPLLTYDRQADRWYGANEHFSIWMDDATFHAYVTSWYNWRSWLPELPAAERRAAAVAHCQRVSYWRGCERNYDSRVHITYH